MKNSNLKAVIAVVILCAAANAGRAVSIPINNGSFENPFVGGIFNTYSPGNTGDSSSLPGWTIYGSIDQIGSYWQAADGRQSLDMNGSGHAGKIQQLIYLPGGNTIVQFDLAGNPDNAPAVKTLQVSLLSSGGSQTFTFDVIGHTRNDMGWLLETANFGNLAAGTYTLEFASLADPNGSYGPALDNVSVSVPDGASTVVLLGAALLGVAGVRRFSH